MENIVLFLGSIVTWPKDLADNFLRSFSGYNGYSFKTAILGHLIAAALLWVVGIVINRFRTGQVVWVNRWSLWLSIGYAILIIVFAAIFAIWFFAVWGKGGSGRMF
jgi:hypothetical protein